MKPIGNLFILAFTFLALTACAHAPDSDDDSLFEAVRIGDKAKVEALLAKGAAVDAKWHSTGHTPLHSAASAGKKDVVELLLAKGADINARDTGLKMKDGTQITLGRLAPLHYAASKEIAELLLAKGAEVNSKAAEGYTPLHDAASNGKKEIAELLLDKGADTNARDFIGTPFHRAVHNEKRDIVELFLARGVDVNAKGNDGNTPLHSAVERKNKDIAELLLAKGADINAKNTNGKSPLDTAVLDGQKEIIELLKAHRVKQARLLEEHIKSNPRAAFLELSTRLKDNPDDSTRRLILKLASELKPVPAIPEEARKHFVEGTAIVKAAKNPAQQALAAQSFTEALKVAPWWGDAYYNLGVAQELAEQYDAAENSFAFYLLSNPIEQERRDVQDRIYALSAKRKLLGAK